LCGVGGLQLRSTGRIGVDGTDDSDGRRDESPADARAAKITRGVADSFSTRITGGIRAAATCSRGRLSR